MGPSPGRPVPFPYDECQSQGIDPHGSLPNVLEIVPLAFGANPGVEPLRRRGRALPGRLANCLDGCAAGLPVHFVK